MTHAISPARIEKLTSPQRRVWNCLAVDFWRSQKEVLRLLLADNHAAEPRSTARVLTTLVEKDIIQVRGKANNREFRRYKILTKEQLAAIHCKRREEEATHAAAVNGERVAATPPPPSADDILSRMEASLGQLLDNIAILEGGLHALRQRELEKAERLQKLEQLAAALDALKESE